LLSYLETGNKQVRTAEWDFMDYLSFIYFTIIAEFIEFLFWHVVLLIFWSHINL
jgi:hypothetical protein